MTRSSPPYYGEVGDPLTDRMVQCLVMVDRIIRGNGND
jgi:hypothetical protein